MPTNRRTELVADRDAAIAAAEAIFTAASGRHLSDEERAQADTHQEEAVRFAAEISTWERQQALVAGASGVRPIVEAVRDLATDAPWASADDREVRSYAAVRRVSVEQATNEIGFARFLAAVQQAASPQGRLDSRLFAAASGGSTGVPSDGGYLVHTDYSDMLLARAMETAVLAPFCRTVPIGADSDSLELPHVDETSRATGSRWGGVQVYRRNEADTVTASRPKIGKLKFELEDLMGIAYMTGRQVQDASAMAAIYTDAFSSEFAFVLDNEIVRGNGNGQCLGVLNSPALVSIAKETGQAAATVVGENVSKMWNAVPARNRAQARWYANQDVEPGLHQIAKAVGTGGLEFPFITYGPEGTLRIFNRPVEFIEQAETLGTVGDLILADMSQYMLITKGGLQADQSMHVRFLYDEMAFRWIRRVNGGPLWKSALTPFKGSQTRSPFVVLATRS